MNNKDITQKTHKECNFPLWHSVPNNEIWYSSTDGNIVEPNNKKGFGSNIVSNTLKNDKGVITFDGEISSIVLSAFDNCTNLHSIAFPISVTSIEAGFNGCVNLESITIHDSVSYVSEYVLWEFLNLGMNLRHLNVIIRDLGAYCSKNPMMCFVSCTRHLFLEDTEIKDLVIPSNVTAIGAYAFSGCNNLRSITIPNSVTSIGENAFEFCTGELIINSEIPNLRYALQTSRFAKITIGQNVTTIKYGSFSNMPYLKEIIISNSVTSIGESAFEGCVGLSSIELPNSIVSIGKKAFAGCDNLESINIPCGVTIISQSSFYGCKALKTISLPSSLVSIDDCAFHDCASLTNLTIPNGVTHIGSYAFNGCTGLVKTSIPNSISTIGSYSFGECTGFLEVNGDILDTEYLSGAFEDSKFTSVLINDGACRIGANAFKNCSKLNTVNISEGIISIGDGAFDSCINLKDISIPNSVTSIGKSAFAGCTTLLHITLPNGIASIEEYTFCGCENLQSINIPDNITYIRGYAFYGCSSLTSINLPYCLKTIGEYAFCNCLNLVEFNGKFSSEDKKCLIFDGNLIAFAPAGLTEYTIPYGVLTIDEEVFYNNKQLLQITIPNSVTSIKWNAFDGCSQLETVIVCDQNGNEDLSTGDSLKQIVFSQIHQEESEESYFDDDHCLHIDGDYSTRSTLKEYDILDAYEGDEVNRWNTD